MWKGATTGKQGYGVFRADNQKALAHRIAYEMWVGPIPKGLTVDHLCGNTGCVNPHHLEAVTMRENIIRSPRTLAGQNVRKSHCLRGHNYRTRGVRRRDGKRYCLQCKREGYPKLS